MGWFERLSGAPEYKVGDVPPQICAQEVLGRNARDTARIKHEVKNFGYNDVGLLGFGSGKKRS